MRIVEVMEAESARYTAFFQEGLRDYPEMFRMVPGDEGVDRFPTTGRPDNFTLRAEDEDGRWLGIVSFRPEIPGRAMLAHKGLLFRMYVSRGAAGQGVGQALIEAVLARASALSQIEQVNLTVVGHNHRARALYERTGFVVYGVEPKAIRRGEGEYVDEVLMKWVGR